MFKCKKCFDEGFDFGPKAVKVACACEAGKRWLHRHAPAHLTTQSGRAVMTLPECKPSDKAGINEKGEVWRFFGNRASSTWLPRQNPSNGTHMFWVRNVTGKYGVWGCEEGTEPGDLVNNDDNPCKLWAVAPFDPDYPDLDPPEVRQ